MGLIPNKAELKSGLKTAFWTAFGAVVFVAPIAYVYNLVKAKVPGASV